MLTCFVLNSGGLYHIGNWINASESVEFEFNFVDLYLPTRPNEVYSNCFPGEESCYSGWQMSIFLVALNKGRLLLLIVIVKVGYCC